MQQSITHSHRSLFRAALLATMFLWIAVAGLRPAAPALASCGGTTLVGTEQQLRDAIGDFNGQAGSCAFEIEFENDITLTNNLNEINNSNPDVSLWIDGAGYTLDGGGDNDLININDTPEVTIDRLTIAGSEGEGIYARNTDLRLSRSTVQGSNWDGVLFSDGTLVVVESAMINNGDNALDVYRGSETTSATIINSTLAGNNWAAIYTYDTSMLLTHVTVTGNSNGLEISNADVTINNSLLGSNEYSDCLFNGGAIDINYSLVQVDDPWSPCGVSDGVDGNIVGQDPYLAPLGDYGGPTKTVPPAQFTGSVTATSPVIDAGDDNLSVDETIATLATDQRGPGFPRNSGTAVDMGAFEGTVVINCPASTFAVSDEVELNTAIVCFNRQSTAVDYTIEFENDIDLSADLDTIHNNTAGISLHVDGGGYTLDGIETSRTFVILDTPEVTIDHLAVTGSSGSGIDSNNANLRVSRSTVHGNDDDGIQFSDGDLIVVDSTLSHNSDSGLNVFYDNESPTLTVINTTIADNGVDSDRAVYLWDVTSALFTHVTIYGNDDGLYAGYSTITINNSILGSNGIDCGSYESTVIINYSLVQTDDDFEPCGVTNGVDGNIVGVDPFMGPMGNYGGPTQTIPPLKLTGSVIRTSPVINVGRDALSKDETNATLATDQRGPGFARKIGAAVDMGAYEGVYEIACSAFPVTVNNEAKLNEAILCFNGTTTPGSYTIKLGADINLTASTRPIHNPTAGVSLVLDGNGKDLNGQGIWGVRPLAVRPDTTVTLNGATITGGNTEDGGGILNEGNLTLNQVNVVENTTDNDGGGIFNEDGATMAINDSVINSNNAVYPNGDGGGIANDGHMTITDSTVSGNTVEGDEGVWAGGIYNEGVMTIHRSIIANNSIQAEYSAYGGGVVNQANLVIRDSAITGNGVLVEYDDAYGGGIYSEADTLEVLEEGYGTLLTIINTTISGNSAAGMEDIYGGGLYATEVECCDFLNDPVPVTLINVTIAANSVTADVGAGGGGAFFGLFYGDAELDVRIHNSILADNLTGGSPGGDCTRETAAELLFESLHSLYEDTDGGACELAAANPDGDGNIVGVDPALGPLANNGGPTLTHLPDGNSEAVDAGDNALAVDEDSNPLATDQRGYVPRIVNGTVDMGAVEVGAEPPATAIFMSPKTAGTTSNSLAFRSDDILKWDGNAWSKWFDGQAAGLAPSLDKHNINAFWIPDPDGEEVILSFAQNRWTVPGITGWVEGTDLVRWDGSQFILFFDGSDVGLTLKVAEKIDGLHILPGSESPIGGSCLAYLLVSTQASGAVPKFGGGVVKFRGEDVLGFCATNLGEDTAGFWHMVLDGSTQGLPIHAIDSISVSEDGQTMYLTTRKVINIPADGVSGGPSNIFKYDFGTQSFSGPFFSAAANGLPKQVDALHVEGDLP